MGGAQPKLSEVSPKGHVLGMALGSLPKTFSSTTAPSSEMGCSQKVGFTPPSPHQGSKHHRALCLPLSQKGLYYTSPSEDALLNRGPNGRERDRRDSTKSHLRSQSVDRSPSSSKLGLLPASIGWGGTHLGTTEFPPPNLSGEQPSSHCPQHCHSHTTPWMSTNLY